MESGEAVKRLFQWSRPGILVACESVRSRGGKKDVYLKCVQGGRTLWRR